MYELTRLGKNTYNINAFTNVGVYLNGNKATLIDSGVDDESAENIERVLLDNKWEIENIIITHAHADHIGGSRYFVDKYNAKVLCTKADTAIANISILNTSLIYGGLPFSKAKGKMLYAKSCHAVEFSPENLPDGIEIIDLKGHSIAMIGVLTDDNVLFCSDGIIGEKTLSKFPLTYVLNIEQYLNSMDKLITLNARLYVPSHSEITDNVKPIIEINKQCVKNNISDIMQLLDSPIEVSDLTAKYAEMRGYTLKTSQYFVVTTTIKNYLAYLEKIGLVDGIIENNRLFWVKK